MQIYVAQAGQQTGPFSELQIESMLDSGRIALSDPAWHEGLSEWLPLHQILHVNPSISQPAQPPPIPAAGHGFAALTPAADEAGAMYLYIPIGRLVAMSILTLGLYEVYWIYRNWRFLKERDGLRIQPFWRAIFGYFFITSLLQKIKTDPGTNQNVPARFSPGGLAAGWIILTLIGNALSRAPDPAVNLFGLIVSAPAFCFLLPVQNYINAVNEALPNRPAYYRWSSGHIVCLVVGIILWLLILIGLLE